MARTQIYDFQEPKSKRAAATLAASLLIRKSALKKKEDNLMKHVSEVRTKLKGLQKELEKLEKTKEEILSASTINDSTIEALKVKFQLTEAEILQVKLQIIKEDLEKRRQAVEEATIP